MTNFEIVKKIIETGNWFNGTAEVSVISGNVEVEIYTRNIFIRMSELENFKKEIEKWEKVKDIEVGPMPGKNYTFEITVIF